MAMQPVQSSTIEAVGYDPDARRMTVRFKNSGTYAYADVSEQAHRDFLAAPSISKHFAAHIKPHFRHQRIEQ